MDFIAVIIITGRRILSETYALIGAAAALLQIIIKAYLTCSA
jgi:hypothetical protein